MQRCRAVCFVVSTWVWVMVPQSLYAQAVSDGDVADVVVTTGQMQVVPPDFNALDALEGIRLDPILGVPLDQISLMAPGLSLRPVPRDTWAAPQLRWDDHPRGARWTSAVMGALRSHGAPLLDVVPRDIQDWCPGYVDADRSQRAAFWAGLISTLAWHESTHRPMAVGGDGRWFGLVQIAPGTARWRNCEVGTGEALLDGRANLRCGVRIMAATVPRDEVVAEGMRGVAADWGPFHSRRKREDMRNWVRAQPYCQSHTRPALRPDGGLAHAGPEHVSGPDRRIAARPVSRPSRPGGGMARPSMEVAARE
jgi:hypothetical protein